MTAAISTRRATTLSVVATVRAPPYSRRPMGSSMPPLCQEVVLVLGISDRRDLRTPPPACRREPHPARHSVYLFDFPTSVEPCPGLDVPSPLGLIGPPRLPLFRRRWEA